MRVLVTSGLVSAAVAAVVSLTIAQAWTAVSHALVAFWRFWRADHQTIQQGHLAGGNTGDFSAQIACIVRVAPSRRWRNTRPMNVSAALVLGQRIAGALAPGTSSTPEVTRSISELVEVTAAPIQPETLGSAHNLIDLTTWPSGLVEIAVPITDAPSPAGSRSITASELKDCIPFVNLKRASIAITTMHRCVAESLPAIYSTKRRGRLDWSIRITGSIALMGTGAHEWRGIKFSAPTDTLSRAKNARPTSADLAAKDLLGRSQDESSERICELALLAWIKESGYWANETVLQDIVRQEIHQAR
jgi:hypothetical protein